MSDFRYRSEFRPQRGQFLKDLQTHSRSRVQKTNKNWIAAVGLQSMFRKFDSLLGFFTEAQFTI
ncbi:MAG: hypothetical protein CO065_12540 [Comamonadaceae bacterium CG_4_9_14_0_8_um_filter_57_21]|nr:MAG: hypothetical protein AUK50_09675 [Comamonadaceae bacterium CG2_30_57_122]PIZ23540.1 MAG: hypothetical protein COY49_02840 [Comamonadaceae bacterium CG_4_10_14_0_8_um_filter_57_29]PJC15272.1 MAG: hypothetical protein CO065_12540 [Comamonadaceae bacterium CG_4_9_14_0_8_um_filter_57_21]